MKRYCIYIVYFLTVFSFISVAAQENYEELQKDFQLDSLENKSLKDIALLFWRNKNLDSLYKMKLANLYLAKAKDKDNKVLVADGYQMIMSMYEPQYDVLLKYSDSIIALTEDLKYENYPTTGYIMKGRFLKALERYDDALETFMEAKQSAINNERNMLLFPIEYTIGELKTALGKDQEAIEIYKKQYQLLTNNKDFKKNHQMYIAVLYRMAEGYITLKKYDSSHFFIKKGIKYSNKNYYNHFYPELVYASGVNSYYQEKYSVAVDSLQKALQLFSKNNINDVKVRLAYIYLSKSYQQQNQDAKAIQYLQKLDSATNSSNYTQEIREGFELLKKYYSEAGKKTELVNLLEKWITYEEVRQEKFHKLDREIVKKYDIPKLIEEKEVLINKAIDEGKSSRTKLILLGLFVLISVSLIYFFKYRRKKEEYEEVLKVQSEVLNEQIGKVKELEKKKTSSGPKQELSKELKKEILTKLVKFEQNLEFLKNDLTLVKASKKLNTNSTYLSRVINEEKKMNFANYVNSLRISYCIKEIDNNKKFRQYSVSSMAQEIGFNNIQSFAKAFSKHMGMNPAEYVKSFEQE